MSQPGELQYFQPSGPPLPTRTWQRRSRAWVFALSVLGAVALAGCAITAVIVGIDHNRHFTATGAVQVDCATGVAVSGAPIRAGDPVRIYDSKTGELLASARLGTEALARGSSTACFAVFTVDHVPLSSGGYLLEIGDAPGRLVSRAALEAGLVLDP
ncbi:hypothetical protein [Gordonia sp. VNK21]|uniref:hypothetical protein n=1 Tax=Gordonia sp. VNK21 TaxID=3382483 RepID=UPI0038D4DFD8